MLAVRSPKQLVIPILVDLVQTGPNVLRSHFVLVCVLQQLTQLQIDLAQEKNVAFRVGHQHEIDDFEPLKEHRLTLFHNQLVIAEVVFVNIPHQPLFHNVVKLGDRVPHVLYPDVGEQLGEEVGFVGVILLSQNPLQVSRGCLEEVIQLLNLVVYGELDKLLVLRSVGQTVRLPKGELEGVEAYKDLGVPLLDVEDVVGLVCQVHVLVVLGPDELGRDLPQVDINLGVA